VIYGGLSGHFATGSGGVALSVTNPPPCLWFRRSCCCGTVWGVPGRSLVSSFAPRLGGARGGMSHPLLTRDNAFCNLCFPARLDCLTSILGPPFICTEPSTVTPSSRISLSLPNRRLGAEESPTPNYARTFFPFHIPAPLKPREEFHQTYPGLSADKSFITRSRHHFPTLIGLLPVTLAPRDPSFLCRQHAMFENRLSFVTSSLFPTLPRSSLPSLFCPSVISLFV